MDVSVSGVLWMWFVCVVAARVLGNTLQVDGQLLSIGKQHHGEKKNNPQVFWGIKVIFPN